MNDKWTSVINQLEPEDWRNILGPSYDTLRAISGGKSICDWASDSFTNAFPPYEIISNKTKRDILLEKLSSWDIRNLAEKLGYSPDSPDVYQQVKNCKFKKNSKCEKILLDYFGIIRPVEDTRVIRTGKMLIEPSYGLHEYQRQVLNDVRKILSKGSRRMIIQMPTGSGKTRTAMYLISEIMNSREPSMVLWIAYSRELCGQASSEFEKIWSIHGNRTIKLLNAYEDDETLSDESIDGLIIITLQKLMNLCEKDPYRINTLSKHIDLLIFDEAHQAVASRYQQTVEQLLNGGNQYMKFIGLTATPGRTWNDPDEDSKLSNFFHKNIVNIRHDGWKTPNEMLTEMGFLSKIIWVYSENDNPILSYDEITLIRNLRDDEDLPDSIIDKLSKDTKRNVRIVNEIDKLLNEGKKRILVFCPSVDNARLICMSVKQIVSKYGGIAYELDGSTNKCTRDNMLTQFKQNDSVPKIICNFNILSTGFDAPNVDAGVIARPTKSLVLFSQMVGRMIRGPKTKGGTEYATIVSVVDTTLPGFKDSHDNWKDVWQ